jgi:hypothetical protein
MIFVSIILAQFHSMALSDSNHRPHLYPANAPVAGGSLKVADKP